ncbi:MULTISPECIES: hypothetical protein [Enterococcus]|uniref:hypothetical protein n=1 Tax=Enterococcus TaxID=1350 RepID=UPI001899FD54|nr:hypothetical protein [Enterococcus mundtii]MBO1084965.1 hypothetical protein [Enterococcus mundtii]MDV7743779.1 hypothetical protein [Enterococcus mundtii]
MTRKQYQIEDYKELIDILQEDVGVPLEYDLTRNVLNVNASGVPTEAMVKCNIPNRIAIAKLALNYKRVGYVTRVLDASIRFAEKHELKKIEIEEELPWVKELEVNSKKL